MSKSLHSSFRSGFLCGGDDQSLLRRQLGGEVRPVADDQGPHFVIDLLDCVEGLDLQTDGRESLMPSIERTSLSATATSSAGN